MGASSENSIAAKCANCAGAVGIASCMIPMFVSAVGIGSVVSVNGMSGMGAGSSAVSSSTTSPSVLAQISSFFSGPDGEIVLLASFILMGFGMWYGRKLKPMAAGLAAAAIIFVGMFAYYSIVLEVLGSVIMVIAYLSVYSQRFANFVHLVR